MRYAIIPLILSAPLLAAGGEPAAVPAERPLRAGMIGLDTSHVVAFTKVFNNPEAAADLAGLRVVAGYPGGTDIPASRDRVAGFTEELRGMGVEIVPSIPALLEKVDVVLLESVDGRPHLEQAKPVIAARKPLFIDKPVAGSLVDTLRIYDLARAGGVPCFSSSSLRFAPAVQQAARAPAVGTIVGCDTWSPCTLEPSVPDMFYYGIHGIESLYTVMGTGCVSVTRAATPDTDLITGVWKDGRIGTFRGIRKNKADYGVVVYGSEGIVPATGSFSGYEQLCQAIARCFKTGTVPVDPAETIEIVTFMEAADESKRQGGAPVRLAEVLDRARRAVDESR
jgi:predicted dehydrogenase